jgi:fumarate hydratase class II
MEYRIERDTMGEIRVPADSLWGAQTQRSLENFPIGEEKMPAALIAAFCQLKKACTLVNRDLGQLDETIANAIVDACDEILSGRHGDQFPLSVWQTGSGTQSNMNCNEVIANRASQLLGDSLEGQRRVHPNDHVNRSQSSNDTFPTAMHVAALMEIEDRLEPAIRRLHDTLADKAETFADIVKIGRTHLQDATPLTLGQEIGGWVSMLDTSRAQVSESKEYLRALAIGGTAVGTGLNAPPEFGSRVAEVLTAQVGHHFVSAANKFQALTAHDALAHASGALKALAANLTKIANDVRWLASGPRCGLGEITIPANEPGSSIMPGKVNPTQCEALTMVACQVFGNDAAIGFAASQGNFELNVYKPVIAFAFLQSVRLLADAMDSFNDRCAVGIEANRERIDQLLHESLMLVTALNPHVGYDNAARIAKTAFAENITLREAAVRLELLTAEEFDRYVVPKDMTRPKAG